MRNDHVLCLFFFLPSAHKSQQLPMNAFCPISTTYIPWQMASFFCALLVTFPVACVHICVRLCALSPFRRAHRACSSGFSRIGESGPLSCTTSRRPFSTRSAPPLGGSSYSGFHRLHRFPKNSETHAWGTHIPPGPTVPPPFSTQRPTRTSSSRSPMGTCWSQTPFSPASVLTPPPSR